MNGIIGSQFKFFYSSVAGNAYEEEEFERLTKGIKFVWISLLLLYFFFGVLSVRLMFKDQSINPLALWFGLLLINFISLFLSYFINASMIFSFFRYLWGFYFTNGRFQKSTQKINKYINGLLIQKAKTFRLFKPAFLVVMHSVWLMYFCGAILSLLGHFLFIEMHFKLESTLLNFDQIIQFFAYLFYPLNMLPSLLLFPVIDENMIQSTLKLVSVSSQSAEAQKIHQIWAFWLLGQITVWGICLRLFLMLFELSKCYLRFHSFYKTHQLENPMEQEVKEIDHALETHFAFAREKKPDEGQGHWLIFLEQESYSLEHKGFELIQIDDRASRLKYCALFTNQPAKSIVIVVDARKTPDRGAIRLIWQLLDKSVASAIYLTNANEKISVYETDLYALRRPLWREALVANLQKNEQIITEHQALLKWMKEQI